MYRECQNSKDKNLVRYHLFNILYQAKNGIRLAPAIHWIISFSFINQKFEYKGYKFALLWGEAQLCLPYVNLKWPIVNYSGLKVTYS